MNKILGFILIVIIVINLIAGLFFGHTKIAILVILIIRFILPFLPKNDN